MTTTSLDILLATYAPLRAVAACPEIVAHQANDVFELWHRVERLRGLKLADVPFWALVWPAAGAMARWLLDQPQHVHGQRVLELGSGGAIVSIAAARAGAINVVANDIDPDCETVALANAAANGVHISFDGQDHIAGGISNDADVILLADGFYERSVAANSMRTLRRARARGTEVLIADSGRPFAPSGAELESLWEGEHAVDEAVEGVATRRVVIGRLR